MENIANYPPREPIKPNLSTIKNNAFVNFLQIGIYILIFTLLCYMVYGDLVSLGFYYEVVTIFLIIRLWPFVVTNNLNRSKNKKLMKSYKVEMAKYEKAFQEYEIDRKKRDADALKIKWELDRARQAEIKPINEISREEQLKNIKERFNNFYNSGGRNISDGKLENAVTETIRNYSAICAAMAVQPIPFADIFILTPTQILMGKKIASLRGYNVNDSSIEKILKEISSIIGMGIIAQQLAIGAYKTFLPFMGGITSIPFVYGLTYAIGKTMDYYIIAKINGKQINKSEIERVFKNSREIGQREGKQKENEISRKA